MNITNKRTDVILEHLQDKHYAEWAEEYGEPGYTNPEKGIVFCNWNDVSQRIQDYLEEAGYELEWSDEWYVDGGRSPVKAYRTEPDSYFWRPTAVLPFDGCEYIVPDDGAYEAIQQFATEEWNQLACLPHWVTAEDLAEEGFELYGEVIYPFSSLDSPSVIAKRLLVTEKRASRVAWKAGGQTHCEIWIEPVQISEEEES